MVIYQIRKTGKKKVIFYKIKIIFFKEVRN